MEAEPVRIRRLEIPAGPGAAEGEFAASARLANLVTCLLWGSNDHWRSPAVQLEQARGSEDRETRLWAALAAGRHVGRAELSLPLADNLHLAEIAVMVHPRYRRRGIGRRLLEAAEDSARAAGRTVMVSWSGHRAGFDPEGPGTIRARTGHGTLPAAAPAVRFARACGYELEQVDRFSRLQLPAGAARLQELVTAARTKAGPDYRLTGWLDSCPGRYLEQYARLRGRMSTEVPLGGTDYRAEAWDGARVRRSEDELRRQGGHALVAAVEHLPGDGLAGYTFAEYFAEKPRVLYQEDTLVLPAHRGRGLGLLLKAANLLRIMDHWPAGRSLYTWNAAENSPMLGINTALGFVPAGCEAAWQKRTGGPQGSPPGPDLVGRGAFP